MNKENDSIKTIENYISFVKTEVAKFKQIGNLINEDLNEVEPSAINRALASYYDICLMLHAEIQREKINLSIIQTDYQIWYDEKFTIAKKTVQNEYKEIGSIKPALKEYEVRLRLDFKDEWRDWQMRLAEADVKVSFYRRQRDTLNRYDSILTTISHNMRSELRSLTLDNRTNRNPEISNSNIVKSRFPTVLKTR